MIRRFFSYELMQYRWGRKWLKGKFYKIYPVRLPMAIFWSDTEITSCGSVVIETEEY
jgi:hypothetical protein